MFRNLCTCIPKRSAMQSPCPRCSKMHRIPMIAPMVSQMVSQRVMPVTPSPMLLAPSRDKALGAPLRSGGVRMVLDPLPASILITRDDVDNALKTGNKDPRGKSPGVNYWFSYIEQEWIEDLNKKLEK